MRLLVVIGICLPILTACNQTTGGAGIAVSSACRVWPYTGYSRLDTTDTKRGNQLNNSRRDGFCAGQGGPIYPQQVGRK